VRSVRKKTLDFGHFQRFLAKRWNSPERPFSFFGIRWKKGPKMQTELFRQRGSVFFCWKID
jgi:hypothetical protein